MPWLVLIALMVTYIGLILFVLPALEERKVVPDMAQWVASAGRADDRVASFRLNRWTPAYRFYVGRHTTFLEDAAEADAFFRAPQPFYLPDAAQRVRRVRRAGRPLRIVATSAKGCGATSGRALWRTYTPLVRFVVVTERR